MAIALQPARRTWEGIRRVVRHESFIALLVLAVLWGGFTAWQAIQAPGRIDPGLQEAMAQTKYLARIEVDLGFTPESFHISYLQRFGALAGVQGTRIYLAQVPVEEVWKIARLYWITKIRLPS